MEKLNIKSSSSPEKPRLNLEVMEEKNDIRSILRKAEKEGYLKKLSPFYNKLSLFNKIVDLIKKESAYTKYAFPFLYYTYYFLDRKEKNQALQSLESIKDFDKKCFKYLREGNKIEGKLFALLYLSFNFSSLNENSKKSLKEYIKELSNLVDKNIEKNLVLGDLDFIFSFFNKSFAVKKSLYNNYYALSSKISSLTSKHKESLLSLIKETPYYEDFIRVYERINKL